MKCKTMTNINSKLAELDKEIESKKVENVIENKLKQLQFKDMMNKRKQALARKTTANIHSALASQFSEVAHSPK